MKRPTTTTSECDAGADPSEPSPSAMKRSKLLIEARTAGQVDLPHASIFADVPLPKKAEANILSFLKPSDCFKARAVSRSWKIVFDKNLEDRVLAILRKFDLVHNVSNYVEFKLSLSWPTKESSALMDSRELIPVQTAWKALEAQLRCVHVKLGGNEFLHRTFASTLILLKQNVLGLLVNSKSMCVYTERQPEAPPPSDTGTTLLDKEQYSGALCFWTSDGTPACVSFKTFLQSISSQI
ncbi:expressed unknown protein [Seminavis robusta]|uniref:F-box domain-containing protein n=1 Tax=Seminavis robusta TaxID=568900 RepID=A0A9N8DB78_9STRA|nr:expressed unknown protein [Seminavis robusta]|eukprot:Sro21_g014680.1 n/a (239) ;mRNA; f:78500-79216